jgi:hypothetical protein
MLGGKTTLIAHISYPAEAFKAPLVHSSRFEKHEVDGETWSPDKKAHRVDTGN